MRTVVKVAPAGIKAALAEHVGHKLESTLWSICKADTRRAITFFVYADQGGVYRAYFRRNGAFVFACVGKTKDSTVARALLIIGATHTPRQDEIVIRGVGTCSLCKWFDSEYAPDPDPAQAIGLCLWPAARLPDSLRAAGAHDHRLPVAALAGAKCPTFEIDRHATE